jgi:pyruvate dehydrogenase E1 component alpha subunit
MMSLIRRFEEGAAEAYADGFIGGFMHLYIGQEAVATGAISALNHDDYVIATYRDHAHALARESSPRALMAELYGRETGICRGKGGSMHFYDPENYFLGGYAIVGGHLPIAAGLGLSIHLQGEDRVVMAFFGDGASNQGVFHESLNMAKLWDLPIIFVCENNFYGIATDVRVSSSYNEIHKKAQGYGIPGHVVNGMDVLAVREICEDLVRNVRQGSGPVLLEARCYRYQGHSMTDPGKYRSQAEADLWKKRDPIPRLAKSLVDRSIVDDGRIQEIHAEVNGIVEDAMQFAEASPEPSPEALYEDLFVESARG